MTRSDSYRDATIMNGQQDDEKMTMARPVSLPVRFLKDLAAYKASLVVVLVPILASPLLALGQPEYTCAYCVVIMALYWMFEVMPLAVTALMPMFLFPILGVMSSKEVGPKYLPDTNFLFMGGLIVAVAVEKCNLHERIALRVLTIVGSDPKWVMLGFMSVTAFLSMWISNTATTAMMVPIAESVIIQLLTMDMNRQKKQKEAEGEELALINSDRSEKQDEAAPKKEEHLDMDLLTPKQKNIAKALLICIAFAANIGGTGTITGTPPNLVAIGILEETFGKDVDLGLSYAGWMSFAIPLMLVSVIACWVCLVLYFLGWREIFSVCLKKNEPKDDAVNQMMKNKYNSLPRMSFAEASVLACFVVLLILWIFRDPKGIPGFATLFKKGYFRDATSAMLISVLLFVLPDRPPDFLCFSGRDRQRDPQRRQSLMDWKSMQERFPWSVVLLLGGGFALAAGVKESGLSATVGGLLEGLGGLDLIGIQFICVFITMIITNICSNTVTASIFVPIVAGLAQNIEIHPLSLALPVTLACSYAFTLPVATPPNAIVFASGYLQVGDMMKAGLLITMVSAVLIVLNQQTYARLIFDLDDFPEWAAIANATTATPTL